MTPAELAERMAVDRKDLEQADRHIREIEERIAYQESMARRLAVSGDDAGQAESLLRALRDARAAFFDSRSLIAADLDRLAAMSIRGDTP